MRLTTNNVIARMDRVNPYIFGMYPYEKSMEIRMLGCKDDQDGFFLLHRDF
jgi:hypothetical protein